MEADLRQFFHVDYRDRFRRDSGYPRLTLRQIAIYVYRRPVVGGAVEAALIGFNPVSRHEAITDDLRRTLIAVHQRQGAPPPSPHPDRLRRTNAQKAADTARAELARERRQRRQRQLEEQK